MTRVARHRRCAVRFRMHRRRGADGERGDAGSVPDRRRIESRAGKGSGALDPFRVAQALPNPAAEKPPRARARQSRARPRPRPRPPPSRRASQVLPEGRGLLARATSARTVSARRSSCRPISSRSTTARGRSPRRRSSTGRARGTRATRWSSRSTGITGRPPPTRGRCVPVLPVSWRAARADARSFGFWPLFYASNKFGWAIPFLLTFKVGDSKIGNQYGALLGLYWWKRSQKGAFDFGFVPPYVSSRDAAQRVHLGRAAELLLAQRAGPQPAGAAALLQERAPDRQLVLHLARLQPARRPRAERLGAVALLVRAGRRHQVALRRPVSAALELPRRHHVEHRAVPADLELQRAEVEHDRRGSVHPPAATTRSTPTSCSRSGGASATTPPAAAFKAFIPLFVWKRDFKARTSSLFTAAGGYSKDETNGTWAG